MKNVVKFSKHFFGYFNTLETHSVKPPDYQVILYYKFETKSVIIKNWLQKHESYIFRFAYCAFVVTLHSSKALQMVKVQYFKSMILKMYYCYEIT